MKFAVLVRAPADLRGVVVVEAESASGAGVKVAAMSPEELGESVSWDEPAEVEIEDATEEPEDCGEPLGPMSLDDGGVTLAQDIADKAD